jgi:hypothetical protein
MTKREKRMDFQNEKRGRKIGSLEDQSIAVGFVNGVVLSEKSHLLLMQRLFK